MTRLLIRNGALKHQKTIPRIQEDKGIGSIADSEVHHINQLHKCDAGTEIDGIAIEIAYIDLGSVDLNDGPVLTIILAANADVDGRREYDMAQNAALRAGPASGNILVKGVELFHRLPLLVHLGLVLLALLVRNRIVHPLEIPNTPLMILDVKCLESDLSLDGHEILIERRVAKENDVMAALAVVLTLEVIIIALVGRRKDSVASCYEEEPFSISPLGNEETCSTASPRRRLGTDGETQRSGNRLADTSNGVVVVVVVVKRVGGKEFGTRRAGNDRLADLDIDIGNVIFYKELPAFEGHHKAVMARKRSGHHPDPEDDGSGRLSASGIPNPNNIRAGPLHLHRVQKGVDLESQVVFPDLLDSVVSDNAELLFDRPVCLRAGGFLPRRASASDQDRVRGQAAIVKLVLRYGWR